MKTIGKKLMVLTLCFTISACGNKGTSSRIRVGSKDFTENEIVAELYSLALEDGGFEVERVFDISGSLIHTSILNDEVDIYPEYTGTGLLVNLKAEVQTDPQLVYETMKTEYQRQFNLAVLDYAKANDGQGIVIRRSIAEKYNITTISELQQHASNLRFASQGEIDQREDGLPMLEKTYGEFHWKTSKVYDNGLKYELLKNDEADVTVAYTTEGNLIDQEQFLLLQDDLQAWPPYNLVPVVRMELLEKHKEIEAILNKVNQTLDTETLTKLNASVDMDKEEFSEVASAYYESIK